MSDIGAVRDAGRAEVHPTYHGPGDGEEEPGEGDPIDDAVREESGRGSRRYGARRPRKAPGRRGIVASRRRIRRPTGSQG